MHRLHGVLTRSDLGALRRALEETHRDREVVLLEIDSPGGSLALGESAMIAMLFSGAPVVAFVPDGARAGGAATLALMAAGLIVAGPRARLGTSFGLGRDAELRLGPFGTRLFDAAQASRSGAVDWLVVSLSDGSEVDGRGALRRGIAAVLARDPDGAARALRGRQVAIPLTGERIRLTGRLDRRATPAVSRLASALRRLDWAVPLGTAALLLFALSLALRPSWRIATVGASVIVLSVAALRGVPVAPAAAILGAVAAILAWAAPHAGAWLALPAGLSAALANALLVEGARAGFYVAPDAGPSIVVSAATGVGLAVLVGAISRRRTPGTA